MCQVIQLECPSCVYAVLRAAAAALFRVELLHRELRLQGPTIIYIHLRLHVCPCFCLQNGSSLMLDLFVGF